MSLTYWRLKLRAMALILLGREGGAEAVFGSMLVIWPDDGYARSSRAHVRAHLGRLRGALDDALLLVQMHPRRSAADWFNAAFLLEAEGRVKEAEPAFRRAIELDPRLERAWYGLGLALTRLGRHDEAVAALSRNTELQPMSPFGWYQLARVHLDRREPDKARRIITHLKGFEPQVAAQLEREAGLVA